MLNVLIFFTTKRNCLTSFMTMFIFQLKELQKKYGNDDRFKLSEKFLDDEDSKDNVEEELADNCK